MKYILIRHGDTGVNVRDQKPMDDLSSEGTVQASSLAGRFQYEKVGCALVSSPYQRALSTARSIAQASGREVEVDERLKEIPLWVSPDDLHDDSSEEYLSSLTIVTEAQKNVQQLLHELQTKHRGETVALVCHGNIIRAILGFTLKMNLETVVRMAVHHTSITVLEWVNEDVSEPFYRLTRFNDTGHLDWRL